jgi:AbrB family looped-hinge helix DNA binding protein
MAEVVSIDKAGRIVIPKAVRDAAGLDERAKLLVTATEKGRVVLQKLDVESIAARLEKELAGKDVEAIVRRVREELRARIRKDYPDLPA